MFCLFFSKVHQHKAKTRITSLLNIKKLQIYVCIMYVCGRALVCKKNAFCKFEAGHHSNNCGDYLSHSFSYISGLGEKKKFWDRNINGRIGQSEVYDSIFNKKKHEEKEKNMKNMKTRPLNTAISAYSYFILQEKKRKLLMFSYNSFLFYKFLVRINLGCVQKMYKK